MRWREHEIDSSKADGEWRGGGREGGREQREMQMLNA